MSKKNSKLGLGGSCSGCPSDSSNLNVSISSLPSYGSSAIEMSLNINNGNPYPVWVDKRYLPQQNTVFSEILEVKKGETIIPFKGASAVFPEVAPESDYVKIEPGQASSFPFDPSLSYEITEQGDYSIKFIGKILFKLVGSDSFVPESGELDGENYSTTTSLDIKLIQTSSESKVFSLNARPSNLQTFGVADANYETEGADVSLEMPAGQAFATLGQTAWTSEESACIIGARYWTLKASEYSSNFLNIGANGFSASFLTYFGRGTSPYQHCYSVTNQGNCEKRKQKWVCTVNNRSFTTARACQKSCTYSSTQCRTLGSDTHTPQVSHVAGKFNLTKYNAANMSPYFIKVASNVSPCTLGAQSYVTAGVSNVPNPNIYICEQFLAALVNKPGVKTTIANPVGYAAPSYTLVYPDAYQEECTSIAREFMRASNAVTGLQVHGDAACRNLAATNMQAVRNNAENYPRFARSLGFLVGEVGKATLPPIQAYIDLVGFTFVYSRTQKTPSIDVYRTISGGAKIALPHTKSYVGLTNGYGGYGPTEIEPYRAGSYSLTVNVNPALTASPVTPHPGGYTGQKQINFNITKKPVTVTGIVGQNKTFNNSNVATVTGVPTLQGVEFGDDVVISGIPAFRFADSSVGNNKPITVIVGYTLTGQDAENYSIVQPTNLSASILPA